MKKYFYTDGENKYGPFTKDELLSKNITRKTKVWFHGITNWTTLSEIIELKDIISKIPPDLTSNNHIDNKSSYTQKKELKKLSINKEFIRKYSRVLGIIVFISLTVFGIKLFIKENENRKYQEIVENSFSTNENFDIYVEKFYRDLEYYGIYPKRPKSTIIKFSNLDQIDNLTHIHGISYGMNNDNIIEIYINPTSWKNFKKPMKYILMYHELSHDILNIDDLENTSLNEGKLMFPEISRYEDKNMDDFIESFQSLFEQHLNQMK